MRKNFAINDMTYLLHHGREVDLRNDVEMRSIRFDPLAAEVRIVFCECGDKGGTGLDLLFSGVRRMSVVMADNGFADQRNAVGHVGYMEPADAPDAELFYLEEDHPDGADMYIMTLSGSKIRIAAEEASVRVHGG